METIQNVATAASKVIFGNGSDDDAALSGQEPVSGERGKGTISDPYDHGNIEGASTGIADANANANANANGSGSGSTDTYTSDAPPNTAERGRVLDSIPDPDSNVTAAPVITSDTAAESNPSMIPKVVSAGPPEEQETVKTGAVDSKLAEAIRPSEGKDAAVSAGSERDASKDESKGTGEKWQRSTGMAAEGGNFDATKPGAGKEAGRLLDEQGQGVGKPSPPAKSAGNGRPAAKEAQAEGGSSDKTKLTQKLKEKLHIGKR